MADKCGYCGKPFVRFPIKGQPEKTFDENYREGTIIWKNFFMMDLISIVLFISILFMTYGYTHDIAQCKEVISDPYHFCVKAGCQPNPMLDVSDKLLYLNKTFGNFD